MEVINRGGIVLKKGSQYRINGELNLSRSFGDRHLKHCMSSTPDLYRFDRRQYKRWVLASDGFYNAKNAEKRLTLSQLSELKEDGTIYLDNASAIFLDF
jgi:serine/threonine protein phosphatase PrpC